jgi:hypothetical protein
MEERKALQGKTLQVLPDKGQCQQQYVLLVCTPDTHDTSDK